MAAGRIRRIAADRIHRIVVGRIHRIVVGVFIVLLLVAFWHTLAILAIFVVAVGGTSPPCFSYCSASNCSRKPNILEFPNAAHEFDNSNNKRYHCSRRTLLSIVYIRAAYLLMRIFCFRSSRRFASTRSILTLTRVKTYSKIFSVAFWPCLCAQFYQEHVVNPLHPFQLAHVAFS